MHLKRLELSGFKSFAKATTLEFPVPVSAVVGPNGSGKSNVVEGIRWVLGEQSMKSLRGKKGEDLIFNGSQSLPRLGKASVSLVFDNKEKIFPFDYEEVRITRRVYRDGLNEYEINDSPVRLKDIVEILSNVGLGSSNHHIISQGEADRILNASSKERRQMVEDALGLKIYQIKKINAVKKLESTHENIKQVESLKREIQPHLKFLKKQFDKAQEFVSLKEDLKEKYHRYFLVEQKNIKEDESVLSEQKQVPMKEFATLKADLEAYSDNLQSEEKKNVIAGLKNEMSVKERQINEIQFKINSLERELGRFEGMIEAEESREKDESKKTIPITAVRDFAGKLEIRINEAVGAVSFEDVKKAIVSIKDFLNSFLSEIKSGNAMPSSVLDELKNKMKGVGDLLLSSKNLEKQTLDEYYVLKNKIAEKEKEARSLESEKYDKVNRLKELKGVFDNFALREESVKTKKESLENEKKEATALLGEDVLLPFYVGEEISFSKEQHNELRREIERLKIRLEDSGAISDEVSKEYQEVKARDEFFAKELEDLDSASKSLEKLLAELEDKINIEFKNGIKKINEEFGRFFASMFEGGDAELVVTSSPVFVKNPDEEVLENVDSENIGGDNTAKNEGLDVVVKLPKKKISSLNILSGGERALTSIALLFAMSRVNPPPFLVLDETDAALDESNSRKYANSLKALSEHTQLIVVTHNRETMKQAGVLYGVTMGSDSVSKLLSIKFTEAENFASRS